tara:strand:- start:945 stop:1265 length:321 start_codon:yes stop_codon:yes gene_type:complete
MTKIAINNTVRDMTAEEQAEYDTRQQAYIDDGANRKLAEIKQIRLQKLIETDFYALGDVTMSDEMKTWRQSLRDIPANHVNEAAYDLLLARDPDTNELTHSIWSKP